jgi:hypothetical protein
MKSASPSVHEILLLHHSHMDVGYTHSQPILGEFRNEYITQAIDWLEQTADMPGGARPKWTCEVGEAAAWARRSLGKVEMKTGRHRVEVYGNGQIIHLQQPRSQKGTAAKI